MRIETARTSPRLTDQHIAMLDFERRWWKYAGAKEQAIRSEFRVSSWRYAQILNALIDMPEALAHDPQMVRRLQRLRRQRRWQRNPDRVPKPG